MKIIFAESGKEIIIDNACCPNLHSLKAYLETITDINQDEQIILSPTGIQIKDKNYLITAHSDTNNNIYILFNRQHLEIGSDNDDSFESLINKWLPTITHDEDNKLNDAYNTCLALDDDIKKQKGSFNISQFTELYKLMTHHIHSACEMVTDIVNRNDSTSVNIVHELEYQSIALNAALFNLENHIKSTYDSQNKFERLAKRELLKTIQILLNVHKDITFMQSLSLHPRIKTQLKQHQDDPSSINSNIDYFSITVLIEMKMKLEKEYERLEKKVKKQSNTIEEIRQQSNHINIQRSGSDAVIYKVMDLNQTIQMDIDKIHHNFIPRLEEYWNDNMNIDKMNDILLDYSTDDMDDDNNHTKLGKMFDTTHSDDHSHENNTNEMNHQQQQQKYTNKNRIDNTIIKLSNKQQVQELFSLESHIRDTLITMINEKKDSMINFFRCLQKVSSLEESIASLLLFIRNLGNDLKNLNHQIHQLHCLSKKLIQSYGIMLIEIWRRDQYYQIITKNAELLNNLFTSFTITEKQYRETFQNKLCMMDEMDISFLNNNISNETCIIPFFLKELDKEIHMPVTTLEISVNLDYYNNPKQRYLLNKSDVQEYISMIDSYYTIQGQQDEMVIGMIQTLNSTFNNELKRLTQGLIKLGLPTMNKTKKKIPGTISFSSPSSPLSSSRNSPPSMQVQPTFSMPFMPQANHHHWNLSTDYAENQDLNLKILKLEEQMKQDRLIFEEQKMVLLEEIKIKDNQKEQMESKWIIKIKELEEQLDKERHDHQNDILEWKQRYEKALDIEQQKHYRRLSDFHERLEAKNLEYAKLEKRLSQSLPSLSPSPSPLPTPTSSTSLLYETEKIQPYHPYEEENKIIHPMAIHLAIQSKELTFKEQLFAQELQDIKLHHQAMIENMKTEHEENISVLKEYHDHEKKMMNLESNHSLQKLRDDLNQEHDIKMKSFIIHWEQKCHLLLNEEKQKLNHQFEKQQIMKNKELMLEKENIVKDYELLKKQLRWSRSELDMLLKDQEYSTQLAKGLIHTFDPTFDINDIQYTLQMLLQKIIHIVSKFETDKYIENDDHSRSSFQFENMIMPFFM